MFDYFEVKGIMPAQALELYSGAYLLLLDAGKIPPHLSLVVNGKVFALTIKGPKIEKPLETQLSFIRQYAIPSLFIQLKADLTVHKEVIYKKAADSTLIFERVEAGLATCLSPLKKFCSDIFSLELDKVNFVYELIDELEKRSLIEQKLQINMESLVQNATFKIMKYSMQDIYERIYSAEFA